MQDPLKDAAADRAEAVRLDWEARHSEDANISKNLTRAAAGLENEAQELENEAEADVEPEAESE